MLKLLFWPKLENASTIQTINVRLTSNAISESFTGKPNRLIIIMMIIIETALINNEQSNKFNAIAFKRTILYVMRFPKRFCCSFFSLFRSRHVYLYAHFLRPANLYRASMHRLLFNSIALFICFSMCMNVCMFVFGCFCKAKHKIDHGKNGEKLFLWAGRSILIDR